MGETSAGLDLQTETKGRGHSCPLGPTQWTGPTWSVLRAGRGRPSTSEGPQWRDLPSTSQTPDTGSPHPDRPDMDRWVSQVPSTLHPTPPPPLSTLPLSVSAFLIRSLTALQAVEGGSALHNSCGGIYREVQTLNKSSALLYRLSLDVCLLPWPLTIFLIGSSQAPTLIFPASAPPSPLPPQRSPWESHSNHDVHGAI